MTSVRRENGLPFSILILDLLFISAFGTVLLAIIATGIRIVSMSNDRRLLLSSTMLAIAGVVTNGTVAVWALAHVGGMPKSSSSWKEIVWRYPVLVGPAAYYLGEFRPKRARAATWFSRLMTNYRALDRASFVAWHGTLATYYLVIGAFAAAILQSSPLFMLSIGLFAVLIPIAGAAFCLLSLVVLVHAAAGRQHDSTGLRHILPVPRIGPMWVRGFRQYYERAMRPALIELEGKVTRRS